MASIKGVFLDVDGVLVTGKAPIPGAISVVEELTARGIPFLLVSNNSSLSRQMLLDKLVNLGFPLTLTHIYSATSAVATYLSAEARTKGVFVVGNPGLKQELQAHGIAYTDKLGSKPVDFVVLGNYPAFTYQTFADILHYHQLGARLIGVNQDPTFPSEAGIRPGAGVIIGGVEAMTGTKVEIFGKPNQRFFQGALARLNLKPHQAIMVGDTLSIDILPAKAHGLATALVLTGNTKTPPGNFTGLVWPDVRDLLELL